jgi:hypothetical protein
MDYALFSNFTLQEERKMEIIPKLQLQTTAKQPGKKVNQQIGI